MRQVRNRRRRQLVGSGTLTVAVVLLGTAWVWSDRQPSRLPNVGALASVGPQWLLLGVSLAVAVVLAYQFPIYIRHNTKLCVFSIPLFLMAALLPPALAGSTALLAVAAGEALVHAKRGTILGDIATASGRWGVLALAGSLVAHVGLPVDSQIVDDLPLLGAAAVMWAGDIITIPLVVWAINGERPLRIMGDALREAGIAEAAQYGIGLLGVLLVSQQVWAMAMLVVPTGLVYLAFKKEVDADTFQLLESMADNIDLRDPYLGDHSRRVAQLARGILDQIGMRGQEADHIVMAARLHDLGKLELPEEILLKSDRLSPHEQALVESYPERGAELLAGYPDFSRTLEMVRHHHERWDGSGYPGKLSGSDIPFGARLIAVADSFDAMISERPYRRALTVDQAVQILIDGRGRQWDPAIVDAFLHSIASQVALPICLPEPARDLDRPLPAAEGVTA